MDIVAILPLLIVSFGSYFLFMLRGLIFKKPGLIIADVKVQLRKPRAFSSFMMALGGTLGVGNIIGVAVGISAGGAGSVFWVLISSIFSGVIKYAEVTLASSMGKRGGMIDVIAKSFGRLGVILGTVYAILCIFLSLTMGSMLQASSIAEASAGGRSITFIAVFIVLLLIYIIISGDNKIESFIAYILPLTTVVYIIMCLSVIIPQISFLDNVLYSIFENAFSAPAVGGGILGFLSSRAIKEGFARGLLSNEAGAGTSSFSHARSGGDGGCTLGIFGMLEVVFDTVILCPLSGICILISGCDLAGSGGEIILGCFLGRIPHSSYLVFTVIFLFALSTILCWYYYGSLCFGKLSKGKLSILFDILYIASVIVGLYFTTSSLIPFVDAILLVLCIISLSTLFYNRKSIKAESTRYLN